MKIIYYIFLLGAFLYLPSLYGQTISNINTPSAINSCGTNDTVTVSISAASALHEGELSITLPSNFGFSGVVPNTNILSVNTASPSNPIIEFDSVGAGMTDSIQFLIRSYCGASTNPLSIDLLDSNSVLLDAQLSFNINVYTPIISIDGLINTDVGNQVGIDLNNLTNSQIYSRTFRINYDASLGNLDTIRFCFPVTNHNVIGISDGTISYNATLDTAIYTFISSNISGFPLDTLNDTLVFSDTIQVTSCGVSQDISTVAELKWGCGGVDCNMSSINLNAFIIPSNPSISITINERGYISNLNDSAVPGAYSICGNTNYMTATITNNATGGYENAAFDINSYYWMEDFYTLSPPGNKYEFYDSIKINDSIVPFTLASFNLPLVDPLAVGTYANIGGLQDLDGDGFVDDLMPDSSYTITIYYRADYPDKTSCGDIHYHFQHTKGFRVLYDNQCYEPQPEEENLITPIAVSSLFTYVVNDISASPLTTDSAVFRVRFYESLIHSFNQRDFKYYVQYIVPKGVHLGGDTIYTWRSLYRNNLDTILVNPGATHDTITFICSYLIQNVGNYGMEVEFVNYCAENLDNCGVLNIKLNSWIEAYDGQGNECLFMNFHCDSVEVIKTCPTGASTGGLNVQNTSIKRATFGWTDSTMSTRVDPTDTTLVLHKAHFFDSLKVSSVTSIKDTSTDSLVLQIFFDNPAADYIPNATQVEFYLSNLGISLTFDIPTYTSSYSLSGLEYYVFDVSNYIDSIRFLTGDNTYEFGGNTGSSVFYEDSVRIISHFYSGMISGNAGYSLGVLATSSMGDTSNSCAPVDASTIRILKNEVSMANFITRNSGCAYSDIEVGRYFFFQDDITVTHFPNEYKPASYLDSLRITLNDPLLQIDLDSNFFADYDSSYYRFDGGFLWIYMNKIPLPYNNGTQGENYVEFKVRPTCQISPTYGPLPVVGYGKYYVMGYSNNVDRTYGATIGDGGSFGMPVVNMNVISPPQTVLNDTVCWEVRISNTNPTDFALNNWLDIVQGSSNINIFDVVDISDSANPDTLNLINYFAGNWVQLDSLNPSQIKTLKLYGTVSACGNDSIEIRSSFNCSDYPLDPVTGYSPGSYTCNSIINTNYLSLNSIYSILENPIIAEPVGAQNFCDTLTYDVRIRNAGGGRAKNIIYRAQLPPSALNVVTGSSVIEWPYLSGNFIPISDPTLVGTSLEWDLSNEFMSGVLYELALADTNSALITFDITIGCPFTVGDQIVFSLEGEQMCNDPVYSVPLSSAPIMLNGLPGTYNTYFSGDIAGDTLNVCKQSALVSIKIIADSGNVTNGNNYIRLNIPDSNINITGGPSNILGGGYLSSTIPSDTVINGYRIYEWNIVPGMPVGDSISFDIDLSSLSPSIACQDLPIELVSTEVFSLPCPNPVSTCPGVSVPLSRDTSSLNISKGTINFFQTSALLNGCNDSLFVNLSIENTGEDFDQNQLSFRIYFDTNKNGTVDPAEPFLLYTLADSLNAGDSISFQMPFSGLNEASYGNPCGIIIRTDSSSCLCSNYNINVPLDIYFDFPDTAYTCNLSLDLDFCSPTGNYPSRTFTWSGTGATYLSNTNIFNPTFDFPLSISTPSHYQLILEIQNPGCNQYVDTITVQVRPTNVDTNIYVVTQSTGTVSSCLDSSRLIGSVVYSNTCDSSGLSYGGNAINFSGACFTFTASSPSTFTSDTACIIICDSLCCDTIINIFLIGPQPDTIYVGVDPTVDTIADTCIVNDELIGTLIKFDEYVIYPMSGIVWPFSDSGNCPSWANWPFTADYFSSDTCPGGINNIYELANLMNANDPLGNTWIVSGDSIFGYGNFAGFNPWPSNSTYSILFSSSPFPQFGGFPSIVQGNQYVTTSYSGDTTYLGDSLMYDSLCVSRFVDTNFSGDTASVIICDHLGFCDTTVIIYYVVDTVPPSLVCMDTTLYIGYSNIIIDTSFILDSVFDPYLTSVWISRDTFTCADIGVNQVTIYAMDINNNIDSCIANVTIIDSINPIISCQDTMIYLNSSGNLVIDTSYFSSLFSDNCGVDSVWMNDFDTTINCNSSSGFLSIYVRDISGNIDSCQSMFTIIDTITPTAICIDTVVYLNNLGTYTIDSSYIDNGSFDNCSSTITITPVTFTCNEIGNNSVQLTIVDSSGNRDSCTANVLVLDTIPPTVVCNNITLVLDSNGMASIITSDIDGGSTDNCAITTISIDRSNFNCADIGINNVVLTVTDASGNIDSCTAVVTVVDNIPPQAICPPNISDTIIGICEYTIPDYTSLVNVNDNCDSSTVIVTQSPLPGTIVNVSSGLTTVIITVTDLSSNVDMCSFDVDILCIENIRIPQFVSPNGDGQNDTWTIENISSYPNNNVKIFNRYGNIIFEANNYQNDWEGQISIERMPNAIVGDEETSRVPTGTYFFILNLGEDFGSRTGYIQLYR